MENPADILSKFEKEREKAVVYAKVHEYSMCDVRVAGCNVLEIVSNQEISTLSCSIYCDIDFYVPYGSVLFVCPNEKLQTDPYIVFTHNKKMKNDSDYSLVEGFFVKSKDGWKFGGDTCDPVSIEEGEIVARVILSAPQSFSLKSIHD